MYTVVDQIVHDDPTSKREILGTKMADPSKFRAHNVAKASAVANRLWEEPDLATELDALFGGVNPFRTTWTWRDTFYEDDADVIAVFDIDHERMKRGIVEMCIAQLVVGLLFFAMNLATFVTLGVHSEQWRLISFTLGLLGFKLTTGAILRARSELAMVERQHVAIANRGVYLDETDTPGSLLLGKRKVIDFDSILDCVIHEYGCRRRIKIKVLDRSDPAASNTPDPNHNDQILPDITERSMFVALVIAMKARNNRLASSDVSSAECHAKGL
jgi:hypothetical protein